MSMVDWTAGTWLNPPASTQTLGDRLVVECARGSDIWADTHYGFHRHSAHALLVPFEVGASIEVDFVVDYQELYDQAGILVRASEDCWVKAGVEISDGAPQLGAVVTQPRSDWSCAPVPDWAGTTVTVRVSRKPDALIVRARRPDEEWRLVRLAPFPEDVAAEAGLFAAAPERAGLKVSFLRLVLGDADEHLHPA
jgi:regulation of enolase protein 1 (concanavalin A-like superfamily)